MTRSPFGDPNWRDDSLHELDCTYTLRRPGCVAWAEGIPAYRVEESLRHAESVVAQGHEIIAESGPDQGTVVPLAAILDAIRAAG